MDDRFIIKNQKTIFGLEPEKLWRYFAEISSIPRGSKNEFEFTEYLTDFAFEKQFYFKVDEARNVLISVPASPGRENTRSLCLQAHIDMVCEKEEGKEHDFKKDGIELLLTSENKIKANGTSLGADNGIGVAAMLAIADSPELNHGPLELLFTVDEETGLVGASALPNGFIESKTIINLDTEEFGEFYISCAGSIRTVFRKEIPRYESRYDSVLRITLNGLKGGHSGVDIGKPHANVFHILARILNSIKNSCDLVSINGGSNFNAIPRSADLTIALNSNTIGNVTKIINSVVCEIKDEILSFEPNFNVEISKITGTTSEPVTRMETLNTISLLLNIPHGVISMSPVIDGLVQTSTNLAMVNMEKNHTIITTMQRGSVDSELKALDERITLLAQAMRYNTVDEFSLYIPGWKANQNSEILNKAKKVFYNTFCYDPKIVAIHAGLECGILAGKFPGADIISFGPTIEKPHSPDESVDIVLVGTFWELLINIIEDFS